MGATHLVEADSPEDRVEKEDRRSKAFFHNARSMGDTGGLSL